ncbi:MAG: SDR family NAD(P)-dependent oxidoreductase [Cytophagales bacterium]|nr:SDR family NAD(P)-dependent oxidoreductase [Cytophagales bacterium]
MKKTVLITGAGGNLGSAVVDRFLAGGYRLIGTVSPGKLPKSTREDVSYLEVNLTDEKEVGNAVEEIVSRWPVVDAAVLLVGGFEAGAVDKADGSTLRRMIALNFETAYFMIRPMLRHLLNQPDGGRIILIGSRPSLEPKAGKDVAAYALSKSLLFTLSDLVNATASGTNVASAVVVPATIDTPANRKAMPSADFKKWVSAEAIADVIFFASSTSSPLREAVLKVYGQG